MFDGWLPWNCTFSSIALDEPIILFFLLRLCGTGTSGQRRSHGIIELVADADGGRGYVL